MAIFHASMKIVGRQLKKDGRIVKDRQGSVVGTASYQGGLRLKDERTGVVHDYRKKGGVIFTGILTPEGTQEWMLDAARLWNAVDFKEDESNRHKTAQLARHLEFALPVELSPEENRALALGVAGEFVKRGMVAQLSIHEPLPHNGQRNPHVHLLLTMREVTEQGFGKKVREWNGGWMGNGAPDGGELKSWRSMIADRTNEALEKAGHDARVDARSYKDRSIDQEPTVHQGKEATALQRRGERTRRGDKQKVVRVINASKESVGVQRAMDENESNSDSGAAREIYEQTGQGQHPPQPEPDAPGPEWKPARDYPRQRKESPEPER